MPELSPEDRDRFLRETRIAALSTIDNDGQPVTVPVWYEWDGECARVFTGANSPKVGRIKQNPRVSLTVFEGVGVPEAWVSVEGTATVSPNGAADLVRRLAPRYYDPDHARQMAEEWTARPETLVVITIKPDRIRSY